MVLDMDKTMNTTKKLSDVIQVSSEEMNMEQLNLFLSSTSDTFEAFNLKTLMNFYRLLKKNAQHDVKCLHVSCVLSCLQHFLDSNIDPLIWEEFAETVSLISGLLFVVSSTFIKDDNIIEKCTNTLSEIVKISQTVANSMLTKSLESLLNIVTSVMASNTIQLQTLSHISCMLQNSSRKTRWEVLPSVSGYLKNLSNSLLLCGDYETQVSVVEVLARCWVYIKEEHPAALFTNCPSILLYFNSYKFLNFDPECRLFLNQMNNSLGEQQLVYSVPCLVVVADGVTLKKPLDPLYKEFWVDFNTSTRSISFYYMPKPEENWELLNIEMENIVCVMATNSSGCKSREGKIIPAVKIDVTLKIDPSKPYLPQVLRIYPRKTHEFAHIEKNLSSKIFADKYKSEVTYTDLPLDGIDTQSPKLEENHTAMKNAVGAKLTTAQQCPEESDSGQSDIIGPSQILETKTSRKRNVEENQTTQQPNVSDLSQSSQCSDTFTHYVKGLNKQDQTSIVINDSALAGNGTASQNATVKPHKSKLDNLNKTENSCVVPEHKKSDTRNEHFEVPGFISLKKENDTKASISKSRNENISSYKTVALKGQQLVSNLVSSVPGSNQMNRQETSQTYVPTVQNNNSKRRHLYSMENMNTKDFVMSSQEDFSLEVPTYKLKKPEPTVVRQRGANKDNISYSYINFTERHKKFGSTHNDNIFTDLNELDQDETCNNERMEEPEKPSLKEITQHFTSYNDKKLQALNKTPENTKTSGLFPAKSVYSDFSSSGKDLVVKKTYARKKSKKGMKRIKVIMSSDSESDYAPHIKTPSVKEVALRQNLVRGCATRSAKKMVDPIRDMVCADEMEIEPMNLEEPDMLLADISVREYFHNNPSTAIKKESKQKKSQRKPKIKKVEPKKVTERGKKGTRGQIKKACSQKDEKFLEEKIEDVATTVPLALDCVNYLPSNTNEILGFNDMELEIFNCTASQEIASSRGSFKMNDMIKFGTCCTLKVKNEVHKVQELLHKEQEMNMAAFDFKVQSSCIAVQTQCQRLETINNNLAQIRVLLDSTYELQKDVTTQIKSEMTQLEITKQEVMKNLADMKKSESSQINSEFKKMGEFMKNWIQSYTPNRSVQN